MKNKLAALTICIVFAGCSKSPEDTAKRFTEALRKGKISEAKKYTTEPSAQLLDLAGGFGISPDINPDFRFDVAGKDIQGNRAFIRFKDTRTVQELTLVKIDGEWKVDLEAVEKKDKANAMQDLSIAKQIATGCKLYAIDNNDNFPTELNQLIPDYLPNNDSFISPLASDRTQPSYEYFGGKETDSPTKVLLKGRFTTSDGQRSVVQVDMTGYRTHAK